MEIPVRNVAGMIVVKVPELELNDFQATQLLPDLKLDILTDHPGWFDARTYDAAMCTVPLSVHTWLLRAVGQTLLINTGAGKRRPGPR